MDRRKVASSSVLELDAVLILLSSQLFQLLVAIRLEHAGRVSLSSIAPNALSPDSPRSFDLLGSTGSRGMVFEAAPGGDGRDHAFVVQALRSAPDAAAEEGKSLSTRPAPSSHSSPPSSLLSAADSREGLYLRLKHSLLGLRNVGANSGAADASYSEEPPILLAHRLAALASRYGADAQALDMDGPRNLVQIYEDLKGTRIHSPPRPFDSYRLTHGQR